MSERRCGKCKRPVAEGGKFCPYCGEKMDGLPMAAPRPVGDCPGCGKPVDATQQYCDECGAKIVRDVGRAAVADKAGDRSPDRDSAASAPSSPGAAEEPTRRDAASSPVPDDGPPTPPSRYAMRAPGGTLKIVSAEDCGKEFPLDKDITTVGKAPDADIRLTADSYVSHAHARLVRDDDGVAIEDLSSRNGTFVDLRVKHRLREGDRVLIGTTVLEFHEPRRGEDVPGSRAR